MVSCGMNQGVTVRYLTTRTSSYEQSIYCEPYGPKEPTDGTVQPLPFSPNRLLCVVVYKYPVEAFGFMPKEAKDCINALVKVADEDEMSIDLVLMVPDSPPAPPTFWERVKNEVLSVLLQEADELNFVFGWDGFYHYFSFAARGLTVFPTDFRRLLPREELLFLGIFPCGTK